MAQIEATTALLEKQGLEVVVAAVSELKPDAEASRVIADRDLIDIDIKELNKTIPEKLFKVPLASHDLLNVPLSKHNFVILDNEHSSLYSTTICIDLDFFFVNVSYDGVFFWESVSPPHFSNVI